jgi:predicted XRE-type DNA-binding protein
MGGVAREVVSMLPDPIPALKQQLADEILASVARLNVTIAAMVLEIDSSRLADLRHGRVARFSVERLIRMLATVDRRVTLTVANVGEENIRWFRARRAKHSALSDG